MTVCWNLSFYYTHNKLKNWNSIDLFSTQLKLARAHRAIAKNPEILKSRVRGLPWGSCRKITHLMLFESGQQQQTANNNNSGYNISANTKIILELNTREAKNMADVEMTLFPFSFFLHWNNFYSQTNRAEQQDGSNFCLLQNYQTSVLIIQDHPNIKPWFKGHTTRP